MYKLLPANAMHELSHLIFSATHFTDEKTGPERLRTLANDRLRFVCNLSPCSFHHTTYTTSPSCRQQHPSSSLEERYLLIFWNCKTKVTWFKKSYPLAVPRLSKGRHGLLVESEKIWLFIWLRVCPIDKSPKEWSEKQRLPQTRHKRWEAKRKALTPQAGRGKEMSNFLRDSK